MVRQALAVGVLVTLVAVSAGCVGPDHAARPSWIDRPAEEFPPEQYVVGLGQAESRPAATERAYAAVARVFKAEVKDRARDWESYVLLESRGKSEHERRLTIDHVTQVSTDKVLENVQVLDAWHDSERSLHYVLAGMHRAQAEAALLARIRDLDQTVETELRTARESEDKLVTIRNLRRAAKHLVLREAYNADLRIVRASGRGQPPPYRVADLTVELERYLSTHVIIGVEVTGEQAAPIRRAVIEGLLREGLPVTDRTLGTSALGGGPDGESRLELLVQGAARLWQADVPDPMFTYVRWCSDFVVLEVGSERVVGAVSRQGREGHLTSQEAMTRAIRVMQQELTADLAKTLAGYIYGDTSEAADVTTPAACPREQDRAVRSVPMRQAFLWR